MIQDDDDAGAPSGDKTSTLLTKHETARLTSAADVTLGKLQIEKKKLEENINTSVQINGMFLLIARSYKLSFWNWQQKHWASQVSAENITLNWS